MDAREEQFLKAIKPFVLRWVGEVFEHGLAQGATARGLSLGAESGAGYGDLRLSGSIRGSTAVAARVGQASDLAVANDAWLCLAYDGTARFDSPAGLEMWSPGCPSRLTARLNGIYLAHAQLRFAPNANGQRAAQFRRNAGGSAVGGVEVAGATAPAAGGGRHSDLHLTTLAALMAGDYLEVFTLQNSGGALSLVTAAEAAPAFMLARIA